MLQLRLTPRVGTGNTTVFSEDDAQFYELQEENDKDVGNCSPLFERTLQSGATPMVTSIEGLARKRIGDK